MTMRLHGSAGEKCGNGKMEKEVKESAIALLNFQLTITKGCFAAMHLSIPTLKVFFLSLLV